LAALPLPACGFRLRRWPADASTDNVNVKRQTAKPSESARHAFFQFITESSERIGFQLLENSFVNEATAGSS
jgi:hypothetical protein